MSIKRKATAAVISAVGIIGAAAAVFTLGRRKGMQESKAKIKELEDEIDDLNFDLDDRDDDISEYTKRIKSLEDTVSVYRRAGYHD